MCDTIIATKDACADGVALFGKNSDREPNEAHHLLLVPAADHPEGSSVRCTYIEIPQTAHTHQVLLAKPFWIWGAEMGANEHGVVIGNEAIFAKIPASKAERLIGMDLLRLGLERAETAESALEVMVDLLEKYGQGGSCGLTHGFYYHNSYIIADPKDAWVLETVDHHWAARRIKGIHSISNGITIGSDFDRASPDLVNTAIQKGWCKSSADFNFSEHYSDFLYTTFSACRYRQGRTQAQLQNDAGKLTTNDFIELLRDHGDVPGSSYRPDKALTGSDVCMHSGFGPIRESQTTGSMVVYLHPDNPLVFVTGTAAPCTSIFKPLWLDHPLPNTGPEPTAVFQAGTLFWEHERLHRATLMDYTHRIELFNSERDQLEAQFIQEAFALRTAPPSERGAFSAACFAQAFEAEAAWLEKVKDEPQKTRPAWYYANKWRSLNRQAKITEI